MDFDITQAVLADLNQQASYPQDTTDTQYDDAIAWAKQEYAPKEPFAQKAIAATQEFGQELWDTSWGGSAIRSLYRAAYPSAEYDWRKEKLDKWKESGYTITPEEEKAWLNSPARPTPEGVLEGESDRKAAEEAFIKSQGGTFKLLIKSMAEDPAGFAMNLVKGILADPELLALPAMYKGAAGAVAKSLGTATAGARGTAAAAGVAAEAGVGAGLMGAGEAIKSEEEQGTMDPSRVAGGMAMGGITGGVAGVAQGFMKAVQRAGMLAEMRVGVPSAEVTAQILDYAASHKVSYQEAAAKVVERYGIDPSEVVNEINNVTTKLKQVLDPEGKMEVGPEAPVRPPETPVEKRSAEVYRTGGVNTERARRAAEGEEVAPKPVNYGEGYGLIESGKTELAQATEDAARIKERYGADIARIAQKERNAQAGLTSAAERVVEGERKVIAQTNQFQPLLESIARKERAAAYPGDPRAPDLADELFSYPAYRPNNGSITQPIMSLEEFAQTSLGKSASGKPLSGAALQSKWMKFHKEMQGPNKDPMQVITLDEARQILEENSPMMRDFFLKQGRKEGTRKQVPGKFKSQQGSATTDIMTYMGVAGLAGLALYSKDHDINDALMYLLLGGATLVGATRFMRKAVKNRPMLSHLMNTKTGQKIDDLVNQWQGEGAVYERVILQKVEAIKKLSGEIPGISPSAITRRIEAKELRQAVTHALEDKSGKKYDALSPLGKELYALTREMMDDIGKAAKSKGVLNDMIDYYVPHLWSHPTKSTEELLDTLFGNKTRAEAMDTLHRQSRVIPTYEFGIKGGLTPRTTDIAEIMGLYMKSVDQAVRGKQFFEALKNTDSPIDQTKLLVRRKNSPKKYVSINHPKFEGWKAHPDIAPVLKAVYGTVENGASMRALQALNFFLKRSLVSLSGFHAKALLMSAAMGGGLFRTLRHPVNTTSDVIRMFKGKSIALQMLRGTLDEKTMGAIDEGLRNGLIINMVDDVGKDTFYEALTDVENVLNGAYEKYGAIMVPAKVGAKAVQGLKGLNKMVDAVMWDRIYTSLKITNYLANMEKLTAKYGSTHSQQMLSQWAAEFTNDAFGGLNWIRLAQNVENKYGSRLAYSLAGRQGRANMQLGMFAPDWTTSNARVFYKSFANKNAIQRELYQRYMFNGMLMFFVAGDALNFANTGHHIWDNWDIGTIELGDGRRIALSKQWWEPTHWLIKPQQSVLNKMSTVASTFFEVTTGQQYIRAGGQAPPIDNYFTHVAGKVVPIFAQQAYKSGDPWDAAWSTFGVPRYGKKAEKKPTRSYSRGKGSQRKWTR